MTRLAVLGSPIAHSKSPDLHRAAYAVLGLPWRYDRVEVASGALPEFFGSLGDDWRGLSLTMPLKREVLPLLDTHSATVGLTQVANTVLFDSGMRRGFNTDVAGILGALADHGVTAIDTAHVIGTGATAASAFLAAHRLGASRVTVSGRRASGLAALEKLGEELGVPTMGRVYGAAGPERSDLVINTLPGSGSYQT